MEHDGNNDNAGNSDAESNSAVCSGGECSTDNTQLYVDRDLDDLLSEIFTDKCEAEIAELKDREGTAMRKVWVRDLEMQVIDMRFKEKEAEFSEKEREYLSKEVEVQTLACEIGDLRQQVKALRQEIIGLKDDLRVYEALYRMSRAERDQQPRGSPQVEADESGFMDNQARTAQASTEAGTLFITA
ncbi:hypothetical protein Micbo1qcDRAFT_204487 [Microdochium bolleyi]|uniref:Uncharacterized protein n=1 Tax=Microdochium bolleyi TaxID=196109 RepID=A0A136J2K4_9PEZI|nr:hypothetical protein Micbo1qcDRAFT_204487 [Microdochium bolleyi]